VAHFTYIVIIYHIERVGRFTKFMPICSSSWKKKNIFIDWHGSIQYAHCTVSATLQGKGGGGGGLQCRNLNGNKPENERNRPKSFYFLQNVSICMFFANCVRSFCDISIILRLIPIEIPKNV
jgi:hypothetical protein